MLDFKGIIVFVAVLFYPFVEIVYRFRMLAHLHASAIRWQSSKFGIENSDLLPYPDLV